MYQNSVFYVIDLKATGERIRELRLIGGLTVREICDCLGIENEVSYYKWQRGECLPSIDHLVVLSVLFGVTIDDILVVVKVGSKIEEEQDAPLPCFLWAVICSPSELLSGHLLPGQVQRFVFRQQFIDMHKKRKFFRFGFSGFFQLL